MAQKFELTWRELPKFGAVLAVFFGLVWMCSGEKEKPQPVVVAPLPPVPVTDARLYIPKTWPGMESSSGFLGGQPNSPEEARLAINSGEDRLVFTASRHAVPLDKMGAENPIKVSVSGHDGQQTQLGDSWSTTWIRGDVMLRVMVDKKNVQDEKKRAESLGLAETLNTYADRAIKMTADERAKFIADNYP